MSKTVTNECVAPDGWPSLISEINLQGELVLLSLVRRTPLATNPTNLTQVLTLAVFSLSFQHNIELHLLVVDQFLDIVALVFLLGGGEAFL